METLNEISQIVVKASQTFSQYLQLVSTKKSKMSHMIFGLVIGKKI